MNRLQGLTADEPFYVTLNATDRIDPRAVVATDAVPAPALHPRRGARAAAAAASSPRDRTAFAGAYHGWGFHEDGCRSGVEAAAAFGVRW